MHSSELWALRLYIVLYIVYFFSCNIGSVTPPSGGYDGGVFRVGVMMGVCRSGGP